MQQKDCEDSVWMDTKGDSEDNCYRRQQLRDDCSDELFGLSKSGDCQCVSKRGCKDSDQPFSRIYETNQCTFFSL